MKRVEPTSKRCKLTTQQIIAAENALMKGDRVEMIPAKDGVTVVRIKRETIT